MDEPTTPPELLLTSLDANVQACVLRYLTPADLANARTPTPHSTQLVTPHLGTKLCDGGQQVARTCRGLAHEAAGDVVWCTHFLRRFGLDFWGEAAGRHPYHSVPEETNEWRELSAGDVFTTFSARLASEAPPSAHTTAGGRDDDHEDDHDMARALCEFAQRHATRQGYGGWKHAYLRMHKMVGTLTKQSDEGLLVAGLPAFDTLSTIASSIRDEKLVASKPGARVEEDLVSPCGECRMIRLAGNRFIWANGQTATVSHDTTICVIRKPRNWFKGPRELFRGFGLTQGSIKLVYVVDGSKVERSDAYQDRAYRELHGVLGEGKGRFFPTMPILMCLLNTEPVNELPIMERLRIPRYVEPHHHCPFYNGAVFFGVVSFALPDKRVDRPTQAAALFGGDDDAVDWEAEADRQSKVADGLDWLLATSTRIARDPPLLLCALRGDTNPHTFLQPPPAPTPTPAAALATVSQPE